MNKSADIERRREQNRIAQRRFRQRQQQNSTEKAQRLIEGHQPSLGQPDTDSSGTTSPLSDVVSSSPSVNSSITFCDATKYSPHTLLDCISSIDMDPFCFPDEESAFAHSFTALTGDMQIDGMQFQHGRMDATEQTCDRRSSSDHSDEFREEESGRSTPLYIAAQKGHDRIARTLLQHNANCNARNPEGWTALMVATMSGHKEVARLLLLHGAQIGLLDAQRRSALHWAVLNRREALLGLLLEHSKGELALINATDVLGQSPLHIAVNEGFEDGVRLLLQHGANVN